MGWFEVVMSKGEFLLVGQALLFLGCAGNGLQKFVAAEGIVPLLGKPAIVPRAEWEAAPPLPGYKTHHPDRITLHHEGVGYYGEPPAPVFIKRIQTWGMQDKGWADVPYHFLIGVDGTIYEGRPIELVGETNTSYDPTHHILISVLGNYEKQKPSRVQLAVVINLMTWLCQQYSISPEKIKGHQDYCPPGETVCPGKYLYKYLRNGSLQRAVKEKLEVSVKAGR